MNIQAMNHLGSSHQYTPMMEHVTCMVAIDTGNGQRRDADNDVVPCHTYLLKAQIGPFNVQSETINSDPPKKSTSHFSVTKTVYILRWAQVIKMAANENDWRKFMFADSQGVLYDQNMPNNDVEPTL